MTIITISTSGVITSSTITVLEQYYYHNITNFELISTNQPFQVLLGLFVRTHVTIDYMQLSKWTFHNNNGMRIREIKMQYVPQIK